MRRLDGLRLIEEFRAYVQIRSTGTNQTQPVILAVGDIPTDLGFNVRDYAKAMEQLIVRDRHLALAGSHAMTLCGGRAAWWSSFVSERAGVEYDLVYFSGAHAVYEALVIRPSVKPNALDADSALRTFCPPDTEPQSREVTSLPFVLPSGWARVNTRVAQMPIVAKGRWLRLTTARRLLDALDLQQAPTLPPDDTPDRRIGSIIAEMQGDTPDLRVVSSAPATLCNGTEDGWYLEYTRRDARLSKTADVEAMYAFGPQESLILFYTRLAGAPEDPGALTALRSLCAAAAPSG